MAKGDKLLWPEVTPARFAEGTFAALCEVKLPDESRAGFIREAVAREIAQRSKSEGSVGAKAKKEWGDERSSGSRSTDVCQRT